MLITSQVATQPFNAEQLAVHLARVAARDSANTPWPGKVAQPKYTHGQHAL